jgi:hypothetical protein
MHRRIATFTPIFWLAVTLAFVLTLLLAFAARPAGAVAVLQVAPQPTYVYLLPKGEAPIVLQTHTADIAASVDEQGGIRLAIETFYRLKNSSKSLAETIVRVTTVASATLPVDLAVSQDGQAAALQSLGPENALLDIQLGAEGHTDLRIRYSLSLPSSPLATIRYDLRPLAAWQNRLSLRVNIVLPSAAPAESLVELAPEEWRFAERDAGAAANAGLNFKWLSEGLAPDTPFVVRFIAPSFWQQISEAQRTVRNEAAGNDSGDAGGYLRLGELYTQLSEAAGELPSARAAFYAQALAAYSAGVKLAVGADANTQAELQIGLAKLYRGQILANGQILVGGQNLAPDGSAQPDYARLAAGAIENALKVLAPEDSRRPELEQWRIDSLTVLVDDAQRRDDWASALALIEQLAASQDDSGQFAAATRRRLLVQQALQLLEQGNRSAAIAIAGDELGAVDLRPPEEMQSLFASWHITLTSTSTGSLIEAQAIPVDERSAAARQSLQALIESWQGRERRATIQLSVQANAEAGTFFQLAIRLPAGVSGLSMVEVTPLNNQWALLRSLLAQVGAQVEQSSRLFRQQTLIRQPIDLRIAGEQWRTAAENLEKRAAAFESQAPLNLTDSNPEGQAEAALKARIQAANYRSAARVWKNLAQSSSLVVMLAAGDGVQKDAHSWLFTPSSPAQLLEFQAFTFNWGRLLVAVLFVLAGFVMLSGVLWQLL